MVVGGQEGRWDQAMQTARRRKEAELKCEGRRTLLQLPGSTICSPFSSFFLIRVLSGCVY